MTISPRSMRTLRSRSERIIVRQGRYHSQPLASRALKPTTELQHHLGKGFHVAGACAPVRKSRPEHRACTQRRGTDQKAAITQHDFTQTLVQSVELCVGEAARVEPKRYDVQFRLAHQLE